MNKIKNILNSFFSSNNSLKMTVTITSIKHSGEKVTIEFRMSNGRTSTARLKIGNTVQDSEIAEFISDKNSKISNPERLMGEKVEIDLSKFPQFYESCKNPPSELVRSIVNHPNLVEHTDHNDENLSIEDMLFKRLRVINGVSDKEARNIAKNEALSMGQLDSLDIGYNEEETSEGYNTN